MKEFFRRVAYLLAAVWIFAGSLWYLRRIIQAFCVDNQEAIQSFIER